LFASWQRGKIAKQQPRTRAKGERAATDLLGGDLLFLGDAEDGKEMIRCACSDAATICPP